MLQKYLPGLIWLQNYQVETVKRDLVSGITIAFMLIPQGMGYALVAGLPPEYGLYACIFPPIVYALLGTSNKISIGPVALDSILIITGLSVLAEPGSDRYLELAVALTLMVGVIQCFFGLIKFGFIANFMSYPVILGYTSAAALIIMASQFESLLGVDVDSGNVFQLSYHLLAGMEQWHWLTVGIALEGFVFLLLCKRVAPAFPGALLLLVGSMAFSGFWALGGQGVEVISSIPQGLPPLVLPSLSLNEVGELMTVALTVALMGYVGTMSICKSQEKPTDTVSARPNQELLAVGVANFVGAFFRAFPVSASFSRSAAFRAAGAATQVSAVVFFAVYPGHRVIPHAAVLQLSAAARHSGGDNHHVRPWPVQICRHEVPAGPEPQGICHYVDHLPGDLIPRCATGFVAGGHAFDLYGDLQHGQSAYDRARLYSRWTSVS